ncbi:MAG: hypothetical protein J0G28_14145 [Afipia sp.]|nr:hypothetical protein [Afipia sp.]OJW65443.1 MAG: hypothetical protein BGO65_11975 [Afipia sp. 64-13]
MVEPIMYLAIGFLVSMLCGLMIVPLVHNRAVRLTIKRLEAATPLSMAEIQADKDQLRAEFAMSARRLEMNVEQLKNKTTSQLAELGKKSDAVNRLKMELGEKSATIFAIEAREKALQEQLHAAEAEIATKVQSLQDSERTLGDRQAEMAKLNAALSEQTAAVAAARAETEEVESRFANLERALATKSGEVADLGKRIKELEERIAAQDTTLAERDAEIAMRRNETEAALARHQPPADAVGLPASPQADDALLRQRISEIAAEVARLTATLEGPESPIEAILAAEQTKPSISNIVGGAAAANGTTHEPQGSLAQRIRALQTHAAQNRASLR